MPVVQKQTMTKPSPRKAKGDGVLDRIEPVAVRTSGLKVLVFGVPKSGKTRFACTFPKPMLLVGTEDGTQSVADVKGLDFIRIKSSEEFGELTEMLREGKYSSACLDTGGGFQDMIVKEILGLDEVPVQRTYGMGSDKFKDGRQMWGVVGMQFKERIAKFLDLADLFEKNVSIIAHERAFGEESTSLEIAFPHIGAALTPSAAGWIHAQCDANVQTFKRRKMTEVEVSVGGKKSTQQQPTNKIEYCLRIGPHPVYMTETRRSGTKELVECIVDPDYAKLIKAVG